MKETENVKSACCLSEAQLNLIMYNMGNTEPLTWVFPIVSSEDSVRTCKLNAFFN